MDPTPQDAKYGTLIYAFRPSAIGLKTSFLRSNVSFPFHRSLKIFREGIFIEAGSQTEWIFPQAIISIWKGIRFLHLDWTRDGRVASAIIDNGLHGREVIDALRAAGHQLTSARDARHRRAQHHE